jgi:hypothetical protein
MHAVRMTPVWYWGLPRCALDLGAVGKKRGVSSKDMRRLRAIVSRHTAELRQAQTAQFLRDENLSQTFALDLLEQRPMTRGAIQKQEEVVMVEKEEVVVEEEEEEVVMVEKAHDNVMRKGKRKAKEGATAGERKKAILVESSPKKLKMAARWLLKTAIV